VKALVVFNKMVQVGFGPTSLLKSGKPVGFDPKTSFSPLFSLSKPLYSPLYQTDLLE
jgi:hypothetical protein